MTKVCICAYMACAFGLQVTVAKMQNRPFVHMYECGFVITSALTFAILIPAIHVVKDCAFSAQKTFTSFAVDGFVGPLVGYIG